MDVEKQREIIRLWNRMRQVEGPVAEEIRTEHVDERSSGGPWPRAGSNRSSASPGRPRQQRNALTKLVSRKVDSASVKI